jgi:hypothetical protein
MEKTEKVDKVIYEIVGFEPISIPTTKYVVTTGSYKGWIINTTLVLRKVVYEGQNDDDTPKFKLSYEVVSTPTPPEKR